MGVTVLVKLLLLEVLWVVCVKGLQPHLQAPKKWFFGYNSSKIDKKVSHHSNA